MSSGLKRVIAHWAVTTYTASELSKQHYHFIVEGDGRVVAGKFKPEDNIKPVKGKYAAHTLNCNTGSIGISCAAMAGAESVTDYGEFPITRAQFNSMCRKIAELCKKYDIPVTSKTVLSHAEVQANLGIKQRGKWDIAVLPFAGLTTAKSCGDLMRKTVSGLMAGEAPATAEDEPKEKPRSQPNEFDSIMHKGSRSQFVTKLQQNLNTLGYGPVKVDGVFGKETEAAVVQFQHDAGLKPDGWAGPNTLEAIGKAIKDRETAPKIAAAKDVVDDAASKGISKTEVITTVTGVGGVATVVKETVDSVKDGASSLLSLGPWILLAFVIAGGAAFVIWDRRRKRLAAIAAKAVM